MKECNKCKIKIETHQSYCPLCHQTLTGSTKEDFIEPYPKKEHIDHIPKRTIDIFFYIGITVIIILGVINLTTWKFGFWSLIPIGATIYIFTLIRFSILSRVNSMKRINITSIFLFLILLFINFTTNLEDFWSVNYILPSIIMTNNFTILLVMLIRNKPFKEYVLTLLLLVLFSLVPLATYYVGFSNVVIMPILTITQGTLILLFMLIFYPRILKDVLQKTFHI